MSVRAIGGSTTSAATMTTNQPPPIRRLAKKYDTLSPWVRSAKVGWTTASPHSAARWLPSRIAARRGVGSEAGTGRYPVGVTR